MVEHALGFALAAGNGVGLDQAHRDAQAEGVFDPVRDAPAQVFQLADLVAEALGRDLDAHLDAVQPLLTRQDDLIVRRGALDRQ